MSDVVIGVSRALPGKGRYVGYSEGGVGWSGDGSVISDGKHVGFLGSYVGGAVIGVEVDFEAHTVSFFENGDRQGDPFVLSARDRGQPLYAAVTMGKQGDQVTLL